MSGVFYEVGEEFEFKGVKLSVTPNPTWICATCYFVSGHCCVEESIDTEHSYPECVSDFRVDGKSVYFEEVKL